MDQDVKDAMVAELFDTEGNNVGATGLREGAKYVKIHPLSVFLIVPG